MIVIIKLVCTAFPMRLFLTFISYSPLYGRIPETIYWKYECTHVGCNKAGEGLGNGIIRFQRKTTVVVEATWQAEAQKGFCKLKAVSK